MQRLGVLLLEEIIRLLAKRYLIRPIAKLIGYESTNIKEDAKKIISIFSKPFIKFYLRHYEQNLKL